MEDVVAVVVAAYGAEGLLGGDGGAFGDADALQTAVNADVLAVAYHDDVLPAVLEDAGDGAVEYGTGLCALLSADVDAFVVEGDVAEAGDRVSAVVADDAVGARDGHGEAAAVLGETAGEAAVGGVFGGPGGGGGGGLSGGAGLSGFPGFSGFSGGAGFLGGGAFGFGFLAGFFFAASAFGFGASAGFGDFFLDDALDLCVDGGFFLLVFCDLLLYGGEVLVEHLYVALLALLRLLEQAVFLLHGYA